MWNSQWVVFAYSTNEDGAVSVRDTLYRFATYNQFTHFLNTEAPKNGDMYYAQYMYIYTPNQQS